MAKDDDVPIVDRTRYTPHGCAAQAFSYALDLPVYADRPDHKTGVWLQERLDKFVQAMPDWLAAHTVEACEALAAKVREAHNVNPTRQENPDD